MIGTGHPLTRSRTKLGRFIRERRLALKLSQNDISVPECGLIQEVISLFEVGRRSLLSSEQLISLSVVLECDMEELRKLMKKNRVLKPITKLSKIIFARRNELKLTLEQFAEKLDVSVSEARHLEVRAYKRLKHSKLQLIATALKLKPSVLSEFLAPEKKKARTELGKLLRSRRKELGLSLEMVADKTGITKQGINKIELGRCMMESIETMKLLANALNFEISELEAVKLKRKFKKIVAPSRLGKFFSRKRSELNVSREGFGALAGMSACSILRIEMGRPVKWKTVQKLAKALKCEIPPELIPKSKEMEMSEYGLV